MTTHVSARIAWHDNGWDGHICRNPRGNVHCIGQHSFPGDSIATQRNLEWEETIAGEPVSAMEQQIPPCTWSINAFGGAPIWAFTNPPDWFRDGTPAKFWQIPPYTVSTWPYEEMYKDEVQNPPNSGRKYNAVRRRESANAYFDSISPNHSLIFYYANYSNPFSEDEQNRYVVVGLSRIKEVGREITWEGQSREMAEAYGPNVWARNIASHYPDQGLRIPYHRYRDNPEILSRLLVVPENPRLFKYATRHISDDEALGLIERFQQVVATLIEIGDQSENWQLRWEWLARLTAELWENRGLYPGLLKVWDYLRFSEAIPYTLDQINAQGEQNIKNMLFEVVEGASNAVPGLTLSADRLTAVRKRWRLLTDDQKVLVRDILPRFDLQLDQLQRILEKPETVSIEARHADIVENPFVLSEQHVGMDLDDVIAYSKIERGIYPSPELGSGFGWEVDDWRRLRALSVEQLRQVNQHTFLRAVDVLEGLNRKLSVMPDWKNTQFDERYYQAYREELSGALTFRQDDELFIYLHSIHEDERYIEQILRDLASRPDIKLRASVTEGNWKNYLTVVDSPLNRNFPAEYERAIEQQIEICQRIFLKPISVLSGAAGTGKTTVVKAFIDAIKKGHTNPTFKLLAPTGKAADRLRERTGQDAATLHSFLAQLGWLNDNFTLRRRGRQEEGITTFIIDESSMLDLPLLAAFFRAVNWNMVQRIIFVGDPNQLPPIGTGKVFSDLIDWLKSDFSDYVGTLETNVRQIENKLSDKGTGIIGLASLYIRRDQNLLKSADDDAEEETLLQRIRDGGDIDGDLRVVYWQTPQELEQCLLDTVIADMEQDTGLQFDPSRPDQLWGALFNPRDSDCQPEAMQIISPYRGEEFGVDYINLFIQRHKNAWMLDNKGHLGGITYWDKVIQTRNRPRSNPIAAYNTVSRKAEKVEIYNGEIGLTKFHAFDNGKWKAPGYRLSRFQVIFSRKQHLWIEYASDSDVTDNLELAYAISVHKSQGSEFNRVYFVLPKHKQALLSREMFYTGITRGRTHCTLFVQEDISPILSLRRPENSHINKINSSLFKFTPVPVELQRMSEWYEEGKIHRTLAGFMVRSKSEVIIANLLLERGMVPHYEVPLEAPDGTFYLPDFTIPFRGETWYWEHLGMLSNERYRKHWEKKLEWYEKHGFANQLIVTEEGPGFDSMAVADTLREYFGI